MRRTYSIVVIVAGFLALAAPRSVSACPLCQEVLASAQEGDEDGEGDSTREARAINNSILFMLTMPYLLLSIFGTLVYRGFRARRQAHAGLTRTDSLPASAGEPDSASPSPSSPVAGS